MKEMKEKVFLKNKTKQQQLCIKIVCCMFLTPDFKKEAKDLHSVVRPAGVAKKTIAKTLKLIRTMTKIGRRFIHISSIFFSILDFNVEYKWP